ncbi:hypothetical protein [Photobacterium sp. R1]
MADTPTTQTWHSGDWRAQASSTPPYNGIEISALPQYDDNGTFVSAAVTITDYTKNKKGISNVIPALTAMQGKLDIPAPQSDTISTVNSESPDTVTTSQKDTAATSTETTTQVSTSAIADPTSPNNDLTSASSEPSSDFTVSGWISLETNFSYVHLRVNIKYGLDRFQREELGYIMGFNSILESTN